MSQAAEIKNAVLEALAARVDPVMALDGFGRSPRSLAYKRTAGTARQVIEMDIQSRPMDNRTAAAALYPSYSITLPEIEAIMLAMQESSSRTNAKAATLRQPIDWTSAKAELGRWFIYQPDTIVPATDAFAAFWTAHLRPLVNALASPADLLRLYEQADPRLRFPRETVLRVAAAAMLVRGSAAAGRVLEDRLGSLGLRRQFKFAFDYFEERD